MPPLLLHRLYALADIKCRPHALKGAHQNRQYFVCWIMWDVWYVPLSCMPDKYVDMPTSTRPTKLIAMHMVASAPKPNRTLLFWPQVTQVRIAKIPTIGGKLQVEKMTKMLQTKDSTTSYNAKIPYGSKPAIAVALGEQSSIIKMCNTVVSLRGYWVPTKHTSLTLLDTAKR